MESSRQPLTPAQIALDRTIAKTTTDPEHLRHSAAECHERAMPLRHRLARYLCSRHLQGVQDGYLSVVDRDRTHHYGSSDSSLRATLHMRDPSTWTAMLSGGTIGAGEAYVDGRWQCDDLVAMTRIFVRNRKAMTDLHYGLGYPAELLGRVQHAWRGNRRARARRNIAAHYDLGNDFFATFLDPSMTYSCAMFTPGAHLAQAQRTKLERVAHLARLRADDHVLEIGSGWGSFAIHAAVTYGCKVTTVTISRAQHDLVKARVAEAGLTDRVTVELCDYRDIRGQFDKVVSIEMIEAVGHQFLGSYFHACSRLLKPNGLMVLQVITIADNHYDRARREMDFIKQHVFPGCCIPSIGALGQALAAHSDLRFLTIDDISPHYAETLAAWRQRLLDQDQALEAMGYDQRIRRLFEYYFAYCEGGFREALIGCKQVVLAKPECLA